MMMTEMWFTGTCDKFIIQGLKWPQPHIMTAALVLFEDNRQTCASRSLKTGRAERVIDKRTDDYHHAHVHS